jgi:hypothetical protein
MLQGNRDSVFTFLYQDGVRSVRKEVKVYGSMAFHSFFREALTQQAVASSTVLPITAVGIHAYYNQDHVRPFLVFPDCPHGSLMDYLSKYHPDRCPPLPPFLRVKWALQAISAIRLMHHSGLIHRDIKPGNFLVTEPLNLLLADMGIARPTAVDLSASGGIGTTGYKAPEQNEEGLYSKPVDIWAYGLVVNELCEPFERLQRRWPEHVRREVEFRNAPGDPLGDLVRACLQATPRLRPTAEAIFAEFRRGSFFGGLADAERAELAGIAADLAREADGIIQTRFPDTGGELEAFERVVAERSWEGACAMLERARDRAIDSAPAIALCAALFHAGVVFDRDDALALRLLALGGEECERPRSEIEGDDAPYARGCVAQAAGKWADAAAFFKRGIAEEKCVLCLVQLALLLVEAGRREDGLALLRMAAGRGNVKAMFNLALLTEGDERMRNLERAVDLKHKGAEAFLREIQAGS